MGLADGKVALILEVCISQPKKKQGLNTEGLYRSQKKEVEVKYQGSLSQPKKILEVCISEKNKGGGVNVEDCISLSSAISTTTKKQGGGIKSWR